jgi:ribosomal 30S subunit maturation factor RimM
MKSKKASKSNFIVQEIFSAALDWIDAIEKLDEYNIKISDEKKIELLEDEFFPRSAHAKK